jgi:ribosomal protein L13E
MMPSGTVTKWYSHTAVLKTFCLNECMHHGAIVSIGKGFSFMELKMAGQDEDESDR